MCFMEENPKAKHSSLRFSVRNLNPETAVQFAVEVNLPFEC